MLKSDNQQLKNDEHFHRSVLFIVNDFLGTEYRQIVFTLSRKYLKSVQENRIRFLANIKSETY